MLDKTKKTDPSSSIVIEIVEDIGAKETVPHVVSGPYPTSDRLGTSPTPSWIIDNEPTRVDAGLPSGLAEDLRLGRMSYEPSTGEIDSGYLPLFAAIFGGCLAALLVVGLLLYLVG